MKAALIGVVGGVLGAIAGGLVTYLTTRSRMRLELEYAHDRELRDKRLPHYQRLFHVSRAVPREWRPDAVPSRAELRRIREEFHGWYFGDDAGGMFLTDMARDLYFRLQNGLEATSGQRGHEEEPLTGQEQKSLYKLASALRHQLSADVGTAQAPRLEWAPPGATLPPPSRSEVRR
jgi:hypothetical protein